MPKPSAHDERWVKCHRPAVLVGGELTAEMLDMQYNPTSKFYISPVQMKANNGVLIIDDFGRQLKIDRSFVRDIVEDLSSRAIAQSVISLGQVMNRSVIAEGVETEEQLECLTALGCHAFQGFLFGSPLPLEEFELLIPVFNDLVAQPPTQEISQDSEHSAHPQPVA